MSEAKELAGGCLCGAVRFKATPKSNEIGVCHCSMCRRWTGGTLMVLDCGGSVSFDKSEDLGVYQSSEWGERGFCKKCGTTLFWKMQNEDLCFVSAPSFDDPGELKFTHEIFIEEKPDYYAFANETHKMTGAEVFAQFEADQDQT